MTDPISLVLLVFGVFVLGVGTGFVIHVGGMEQAMVDAGEKCSACREAIHHMATHQREGT